MSEAFILRVVIGIFIFEEKESASSKYESDYSK